MSLVYFSNIIKLRYVRVTYLLRHPALFCSKSILGRNQPFHRKIHPYWRKIVRSHGFQFEKFVEDLEEMEIFTLLGPQQRWFSIIWFPPRQIPLTIQFHNCECSNCGCDLHNWKHSQKKGIQAETSSGSNADCGWHLFHTVICIWSLSYNRCITFWKSNITIKLNLD